MPLLPLRAERLLVNTIISSVVDDEAESSA